MNLKSLLNYFFKTSIKAKVDAQINGLPSLNSFKYCPSPADEKPKKKTKEEVQAESRANAEKMKERNLSREKSRSSLTGSARDIRGSKQDLRGSAKTPSEYAFQLYTYCTSLNLH